MFEDLTERFVRYAKVNTRSDETSETIPTTASQVEFAHMLAEELKVLGFSEVVYNKSNGYVTATLPANTSKEVPTIGFISHIDTADFNSINIQPQFHENYDGKIIVLNETENIELSPKDFPNLNNYIGDTLITTNGLTLLGADDKAGIAEIITAASYLLKNDSIEHGEVRLGFGPDEEIGIGADRFDVEGFNADYAYTVDGGPVGELEYESFNAAAAKVSIQGQNVHPGTAKDLMINALTLGIEFDNQLPDEEVPEKTEGREGFYHLLKMNGTVENATLEYIIRDHDRIKFNERKDTFLKIAEKMNTTYFSKRIQVEMYDQYYNMAEVIEKDMTPVNVAKRAMENIGIDPIIKPIRGGTDGSKISFMGLPTPNIFAGGENFHGRYEYVSVQSMEKATRTIIEIIKEFAKL